MSVPGDHDTIVDHGPGDGGWGPAGPLPEPGWYDDPWSPENIRRWDGQAWTGETARKEAGSPAAAPAASTSPSTTPSPPSGPSGPKAWLRANPLIVALVAVAVVVIGIVVVMSGSGHSGPSSTSTTVAAAPVPTTTAPVGLSGGVLAMQDLGAGWTAVGARALTPREYMQGPCGSSAWVHNVGGYQSGFVKGASAATAHGSVVSRVVEAPGVEIANQQQAVVTSPFYGACLQRMVTAEVRSQLPAGSGQSVTSAMVTPFTLDLPITTRAYVVSVTVAGPRGATRVVTDNAVALFSGRYAATLDVSWSSDAPLTSQIVQQEAADEAAHLAALS